MTYRWKRNTKEVYGDRKNFKNTQQKKRNEDINKRLAGLMEELQQMREGNTNNEMDTRD